MSVEYSLQCPKRAPAKREIAIHQEQARPAKAHPLAKESHSAVILMTMGTLAVSIGVTAKHLVLNGSVAFLGNACSNHVHRVQCYDTMSMPSHSWHAARAHADKQYPGHSASDGILRFLVITDLANDHQDAR